MNRIRAQEKYLVTAASPTGLNAQVGILAHTHKIHITYNKSELWNEETKNDIIRNGGSVQNLSYIPIFIKEKYKIVWEIPMKHIIEMSADRGVYICQSQSMNLWMKDPNYKKLTSMINKF